MEILRRIGRRLSTPRWAGRLPSVVTYEPPLARDAATLPAVLGGTNGVWCEPPCRPRMMGRPGPSFHDDPDGAGLFRKLGEMRFHQAPAFVAAAERAFLVGSRTVVTADGTFFNDEVYDAPAGYAHLCDQDPFRSEYCGFVRSDAPERFKVERRDRPIVHIDGDVVSLCSLEGGNFGSFLFRVLPKLASFREGLGDVKFIVPPLWPANREVLRYCGVAEERIVEQKPGTIYAADRMIVPSLRNPHALLDGVSLALFAGLQARHGASGSSRIYVSRAGWDKQGMGQRPMLNEAEVMAALRDAGFNVVRPHEMSGAEQIACFSSASLVVGAAGSAMFNAVFCRPGTKVVDIESEPHWIFTHCNLFGSCGLDYGIFEAKAADSDWSRPHKPLAVNVKALIARIEQL